MGPSAPGSGAAGAFALPRLLVLDGVAITDADRDAGRALFGPQRAPAPPGPPRQPRGSAEADAAAAWDRAVAAAVRERRRARRFAEQWNEEVRSVVEEALREAEAEEREREERSRGGPGRRGAPSFQAP